MYKILSRKRLNPTVIQITVHAPDVAAKAEPGQFVILRVDALGERVPFTVADFDRQAGTVTVIFQVVGAETYLLAQKKAGDTIADFVGPLGNPSHVAGLGRVAVVGGGVGCAIAYPVAKRLHALGTRVDAIIGFRTRDLVILEDAFAPLCATLAVMTDDGTHGARGFVTDALAAQLQTEAFDQVVAIGPLVMMKAVCQLTRPFGVKTIVSMNPIMIDGTGMCGGCRLTVDGQTRFACVDGPEFDGHLVDFDRLMHRNRMYHDHERRHLCRLTGEEAAPHA